jgi:hypothetical protein
MNKANRAAHAMVKCGWNGVRELKKGSGWQTLKKNSLKCLRDDAMELHQAHILSLTQQATNLDSTEKRRNRCHQARLHVFLSLPSLDGVTGSSLGTNPEDKLVLGRCLEPSTNIGPAMMAKMLKENGWCTHRTTLRGLTEEEIRDPDKRKARLLFDEDIKRPLGPSAKPEDFKEDIELENLDWQEDCDQEQIFAPDQDNLPG